ncbi:MAG: hypothetical protein WCA11_10545 [Terracidiphilus sp.]
MKPENIGRALGIGLRVAGRVAGERMSGSTGTAPNAPATNAPAGQTAVDGGVRARTAGQAAVRTGGGVMRGVAGFLRPFGRVGGILWLEVTGLFFLIFVPVFVWRGMWPARASYLHGPEHLKFLVYTGLTLVFLYLGVSSFWRASKK